MGDFGAPVRSWVDTAQDGVTYWGARWQAFNNDASSIGYWDETLQAALTNKIVSIDHGSLYTFTTNAVRYELYMFGKSSAEAMPIMYETSTAGAYARTPFYGPFRPMSLPALGAVNYAIQLTVFAGGNAADDYDLSVYGRAWERRTNVDAPEYVQPVSVREAQIWPWKR